VAVLLNEAIEPAEVVAMTMAQDETVDAGRIDAEQVEIAVDDLGRVAEVENVLRFRAILYGGEVQREPPLGGKGLSARPGMRPMCSICTCGCEALGRNRS
jgi:hypothetical protein